MAENPAEKVAQAFHESYERQAPNHGYTTRKESAVPWWKVPERNKALMIAVVQELMDTGVIAYCGDDPFAQARKDAGLEVDHG